MITYEQAGAGDIQPIYNLCKHLIDDYEDTAGIEYDKVLKWVRRKLESTIGDYTAVFVSGEKAGYYHFYQNEDREYEIDDLYIFPEYRNQGIGSEVIEKCCAAVQGPVMLYVFVRNEKAISLYKRLGFEIVERVGNTRYIMKRQ